MCFFSLLKEITYIPFRETVDCEFVVHLEKERIEVVVSPMLYDEFC